MDKRAFGQWLLKQLNGRMTLQQLKDQLEIIGVSRSDEYLAELCDGKRAALKEDEEALERVFGMTKGTLSNADDEETGALWSAFHAELAQFPNLAPYEQDLWERVRSQFGGRLQSLQTTRAGIQWFLRGQIPQTGRSAIGECTRCHRLLYTWMARCPECGLPYDAAD